MLQRTRLYIPGCSAHVIRRGNNRMSIFGDDSDYELFLAMLEGTAAHNGVDVHAFVLMTNHYHLIVTPRNERALPAMMRELGARYVRRFNARYGRIGTPWTGRYRSILITDEAYWLTCLRYIEHNPVRAQMVTAADEYRWSSYRVHGSGDPHPWLVPHPVYEALGNTRAERAASYRALCGNALTEADLVRQRLGPQLGTGQFAPL